MPGRRKTIPTICVVTGLMLSENGVAQGFVNLNFESAVIVTQGSPNLVLASKAIPGWTNGYPGGAVIFYNTVTLGSAAVSIHDTNETPFLGFVLTPLQGKYSVYIEGSSGGTPTSAYIAQTGQIPPYAKSLTFLAQLGSLQITFNGRSIPYSPFGSGADYTIYEGDISQFAGQLGELRFTALPNTYGFLDNIQFSSQPIPEPSSLALLGLGALLFFRRLN